jgi:hypothetical protein
VKTKHIVTLLFSVLALCSVASRSEAGLVGQTIDVLGLYPDTSTIFFDSSIVAPPVVLHLVHQNITIGDTTIAGAFFHLASFAPAAFNGFVLTDLTSSDITGVSIDPITNFAGFTTADLSFTSNTVTWNFQNLDFDRDTVWQLDVQFAGAVPEPASISLFLVGLGLIGALALRPMGGRGGRLP